ncbi:FAD-binding protein [Zafaria cholistanensis]|uniref:FAD-binding protein n=1 Tax=Zafaria cholistanensis TaxID=1682741 RepID=A0A5A7NP54_9MICC|nr:FAD-dependent oxidoreductase [Zafaria cholistanensis]GER22316.1 FAD-binding protein [Zafaria cholistanensis]
MNSTASGSAFDVVVLGSGASGLCAALAAADAGARVGVFEKAPVLGGTTCLSSAVVWMPNNRYARERGIQDSRADALAYLGSLSNGMILRELAEAFVDTVPELLDWLDTTPMQMSLVPGYPDYHPEQPGGKPGGGRSLEPQLFSLHGLGAWAGRLGGTPRRMVVGETPIGGGTGFLTPEVAREREEQQVEGLGRAMVAALLQGCLEKGVEVHLNERAVQLRLEDGAVRGVALEGPRGLHEVAAHRGVVLATGGFEWDKDLARDFLRGPITHPASVPTNTGDGLRMAMRVGASLGNMREAWWVPVCTLPGENAYGTRPVYLVQRERTVPHSIMVNREGKRFANEAANYNAMGGAFHELDPTSFDYRNIPCWVVFDARMMERFGGFGSPPGAPVPEWIIRADTLVGLADRIGVPADALVGTVERWNGHAKRGIDPDFRRGESAFDGFVGNRDGYPGAESTFGTLERGPFYAVELHSSTLGTKGGPRTTSRSEVLTVDGEVIPGLFAAGNVMAGPTGMVYGGAGGTLGPGLVFGYLAGRTAAGRTTADGWQAAAGAFLG